MSENRELSDVMIEFVSRLEADGVDELSLELVKLRWIPEIAALEARLEEFQEALIWCSGSPDFNEGGQAREGWLKLCAPLLADIHEASEAQEGTK
jgi:hypothetical protein